jgi:hypothetical protein
MPIPPSALHAESITIQCVAALVSEAVETARGWQTALMHVTDRGRIASARVLVAKLEEISSYLNARGRKRLDSEWTSTPGDGVRFALTINQLSVKDIDAAVVECEGRGPDIVAQHRQYFRNFLMELISDVWQVLCPAIRARRDQDRLALEANIESRKGGTFASWDPYRTNKVLINQYVQSDQDLHRNLSALYDQANITSAITETGI